MDHFFSRLHKLTEETLSKLSTTDWSDDGITEAGLKAIVVAQALRLSTPELETTQIFTEERVHKELWRIWLYRLPSTVSCW